LPRQVPYQQASYHPFNPEPARLLRQIVGDSRNSGGPEGFRVSYL
jgi:hypothetical protein